MTSRVICGGFVFLLNDDFELDYEEEYKGHKTKQRSALRGEGSGGACLLKLSEKRGRILCILGGTLTRAIESHK